MYCVTSTTGDTMNIESISKAFTYGKDNALGFPVGEEGLTVAEAIAAEGWEVVYEAQNDGEVTVCHDGDRVIAIADVSGAYAVDVTAYNDGMPTAVCSIPSPSEDDDLYRAQLVVTTMEIGTEITRGIISSTDDIWVERSIYMDEDLIEVLAAYPREAVKAMLKAAWESPLTEVTLELV